MEFDIPKDMLEEDSALKIELHEEKDVVHAHGDKGNSFVWSGIAGFRNAWQEFMSGRGQVSDGEDLAFVGDPFDADEKKREGWKGSGGILVLSKAGTKFKMRVDAIGDGHYDYVIHRDESLNFVDAKIMLRLVV